MNFVAKCVRPARLFISRMLHFLKNMSDNINYPLSLNFIKDLKWWQCFLLTYNGVSMMVLEEWSKPDEILSCDACLTGCGGWFNGKYFHKPFQQFITDQSLHINELELLTVVICLKTWGNMCRNQRIVIYCDNLTSITVLNSGRTHDIFLQKCLREITYLCAILECEIKGVHIDGVNNRIPDLLRRWHVTPNKHTKLKELTRGYYLLELLKKDLHSSRCAAFAESTRINLLTQWRS